MSRVFLGLVISFFAIQICYSQNVISAPKSYAIIIGINDYKHIPKLSFAKNDAISFYNLLLSPSFNLKKENIYLLLDNDANYKNCYDALYNLSDSIKQNDVLYFYFSGHGDIESKLSINNPLLLLTNSPSTSYFRENEFLEINRLKDYFIKLSTKNIRSYFVCDACHSGANLVGGIEGAKKTNEGLLIPWTNEIRLLSCQSNELSQESNRWGHGRGVFSFYLELALKGMSDNNKDGEITLGEVKRYIESQVANNTNERQNPSVTGDPKKIICDINAYSLASAKQLEAGVLADNSLVTINRGVPEKNEILIKEFLAELKKENDFIYVNNDIITKANYLLKNSTEPDKIEPELFDYCSRKFYKLIQLYYDNEKEENLLPQENNFKDLEKFISDCLSLFGNNHFVNELKVYLKFLEIENQTLGIKTISHAYASNCITTLISIKKENETHPFISKKLCELYLSINDFNSAEKEVNQYLLLLPNDPFAYNYLGMINYRIIKYQNAVNAFQKAIILKPDFYNSYFNLGITYQALNMKDAARSCFKKAENLHQPKSEAEY